MLTVEDWAEARRLHQAEGMPVKAIARALGISRNTVRPALASDGPPKYRRKPAGSAVHAFEPRIWELLQAYPAMPATVIAERIGWERGLTVLKDRVRELRSAGGGHLYDSRVRRCRESAVPRLRSAGPSRPQELCAGTLPGHDAGRCGTGRRRRACRAGNRVGGRSA